MLKALTCGRRKVQIAALLLIAVSILILHGARETQSTAADARHQVERSQAAPLASETYEDYTHIFR